jgi:FtsP/CotA-like multicopper oxidase with cupredoxin domain
VVTPRQFGAFALLLLVVVTSAAAIRPDGFAHAPLPRVEANDNRSPAGTLVRDTLRLKLSVVRARWFPEADSGPFVDVIALAEEGRGPQIPGPMIRVPEGTVIDLTLRNALEDSTLFVAGLYTRPADGKDTLQVSPGTTSRVTFAVGASGTYFYSISPGAFKVFPIPEKETISGAFIVDPPGQRPDDRVLVINIWGYHKDSTTYPNALAINGRSWPNTERLTGTVGDTLRWRVINASQRGHPMHLHGFYFTVIASGDVSRDTIYAEAARRLAVTEQFRPFQTRDLTIIPDRPGNWLYHCHLGFHVVPGAAQLNQDATHASHATMSADAGQHMAGLVIGLTINPRPGTWHVTPRAARTLSLFVNEGAKRDFAPRAMRYVLQRGATVPAADSLEPVSSTLILTRGEPTDIVVHNRLKDATSVHWHGIELESYSDGVAGWSGTTDRLAPMIAPTDSFVAHLTLARAGTFIYHTHLVDVEQLSSGLFGALIVLEPGQRFDPITDHIFVAGWDGLDDPERTILNGETEPTPLVFQAGRTHRMRLVGIGLVRGGYYTLTEGKDTVQWRAIAKDGADLPPTQATVQRALVRLQAGETYDFEWTPAPGEYVLSVTMTNARPPLLQKITVR